MRRGGSYHPPRSGLSCREGCAAPWPAAGSPTPARPFLVPAARGPCSPRFPGPAALSLILSLALAGCGDLLGTKAEKESFDLASLTPHPDSLLHHVEALAHDSMRGRGSGSVDELRAAEYLRERMVAYGLQAPSGGMIQSFDAVSRRGDSLLSSRNVLAVLPGSGRLAAQWIVVGGHYDHIGYRNLPDESQGPNNGADDNASGTAMVLEMARVFSDASGRGGKAPSPRRSILFAFWGAEEEGLLGSCHYVYEAPKAPLGWTGALMNFDMVGRLRGDTLVVSGGETSPVWNALVLEANTPALTILRPQNSSPSGTDHSCFWQTGIPWVGFFTRLHPEYHTPLDDVELINLPGMVRVGELAMRILAQLVIMPRAPEFQGPIPSM
jgi:hypothetical protein